MNGVGAAQGEPRSVLGWLHDRKARINPTTTAALIAAPEAGYESGTGVEMASSKEWFETVAEAQRRAKKRLPKSVYMALVAGSEQGLTLDDNVNAFSELGFRPHIADLPQDRDQATTGARSGHLLPGDHLADRGAGGAARTARSRWPAPRRPPAPRSG